MKQRREMKVALLKVTECVSGVALDFQEEKWDIAKWSMPLDSLYSPIRLNGHQKI